ncbi:DDE-type integrase/transposase/recombinase [Saccharopolyspora pogona]|uniref:DDE-type integrase/transposase/recombinase n=1 Tax=Saccharopolyspora pogona TaxID=333966 RepID=UPI001CC2251D|nr:DDE-type integrase/transposase/recombinase [Saccharopolyspora pogona]
MDPDLVAAVAAVAGGDKINVSGFCAEHKISRTVFYKYVNRFRQEGAAGFIRRSSAPHRRPTASSARVREAVVRARKQLAEEGRDNGAISIGWRLEELGEVWVPSRATIHRILVDEGHVTPQPRKRPRTRRRFEYTEANGLWQVDGMEFYLAGGEKVCILQILDDHSRLDVGTYAASSQNGDEAWAALQQAFAGYGVPVKVLTDNGLAFSGKHRGSMVDLERRLADWTCSTPPTSSTTTTPVNGSTDPAGTSASPAEGHTRVGDAEGDDAFAESLIDHQHAAVARA